MSLVIKGEFDVYDESVIDLSASGGTHATFTRIDYDVKGADEITLFIINGVDEVNGIENGNSTNLDVNIYGDVGLGYTTVPITTGNLGANSSDMIFCLTGFYKLKVEFVNLDSSATIASYRLVVKK